MDKGPPAFKFVLVLIDFLLSDLLKAVRMPIANTPNSNAADYLESIAVNGDRGPGITPSGTSEPLSCSASDYLIG
jgi:hypothetical protein